MPITLKITDAELRRFENAAAKELSRIIGIAMNRMDEVLFKEAERLADLVKNSPEFEALKTPTLIGQFGFTPQEVANLDSLFPVIGPKSSNNVTSIRKKLTGRSKEVALNWVDFQALKEHPIAQHPLTRFDQRTQSFQVEQIVSWIQWWEEGVTIRGHIFTRGTRAATAFSRSGEGIMRTSGGGFFAIRPTRIFERISTTEKKNTVKNIESGFAKLVKTASNA